MEHLTSARTSKPPACDHKLCNMLQPCTVLATIAQDAAFRIQTALLWIRCNTSIHRRATTKSLSSEALSDMPTIQLSDAIDGRSRNDETIFIREDKPDLGLLHLHRDRLAAAAEALGWRSLACLQHNEEALGLLRNEVERHMRSQPPLPSSCLELCKVRILVSRNGEVTIDSIVLEVETPRSQSSLLMSPFMPISFDQPWKPDQPLCKVYLDRQPTRPSTLTTHKTTHRCVYTTARERLNMTPSTSPTSQEVLLYNPYGEVIETSCCTVYLKRNGGWITPAAICGPTLGVSRRLAIEKGLCTQGTSELRELRSNEEVWLSNAVRGFFKGIIITDAKRLSESAESKEILCAKMNVGLAQGVSYTKATGVH